MLRLSGESAEAAGNNIKQLTKHFPIKNEKLHNGQQEINLAEFYKRNFPGQAKPKEGRAASLKVIQLEPNPR